MLRQLGGRGVAGERPQHRLVQHPARVRPADRGGQSRHVPRQQGQVSQPSSPPSPLDRGLSPHQPPRCKQLWPPHALRPRLLRRPRRATRSASTPAPRPPSSTDERARSQSLLITGGFGTLWLQEGLVLIRAARTRVHGVSKEPSPQHKPLQRASSACARLTWLAKTWGPWGRAIQHRRGRETGVARRGWAPTSRWGTPGTGERFPDRCCPYACNRS